MYQASRFVVRTGSGTSGNSRLNAVDRAMIDAGVGEINLIQVSSVLPAGIEEVVELDKKARKFTPCVMSSNVGKGVEIAAGIAYARRADGEGGYIVEHSESGEELNLEAFRAELKSKLTEMGDVRDVDLEEGRMYYNHLKVPEDEHGAVIAVLVYLP